MPKPAVRNTHKSRMAKAMEPRLQQEALSVLRQWWQEAVSRSRSGKVAVPLDYKQRWPKAFQSALRSTLLQVSAGAWDLAGEELGLGAKSALAWQVAKKQTGVDIGDESSFLLEGDPQNIDKYLQDTSKSVAQRHSGFLDELFNKAQSYVDPDTGAGMTPADIAKYLADVGGPFTESYSRMIARTTSSWSSNEGAKQRYTNAGVTYLEWFTTEDDVTCEFCAALDGKRIPVEGTFAGPGFPVGGIDPDKYFSEDVQEPTGESMDMPFGIEHPPLHPNCRCTLLPVADSLVLAEEVTTAPEEPLPSPPVQEQPSIQELLFENLEMVENLGGSTGAQLMKDKISGLQYVVKAGKSAAHVTEEYNALQLYKSAGVKVPEGRLMTDAAGKTKLVMEYMPGRKTLKQVLDKGGKVAEKALADARANFVADAFFGNWDAVGATYDNMLVYPANGKVYRIDLGGALRYRAQGALKNNWGAGNTIEELKSLRNPAINKTAAHVFGSLDSDEILKQAKSFYKKRNKILAAAPEDLKGILTKRFSALQSDIKEMEKLKKAASLPSPKPSVSVNLPSQATSVQSPATSVAHENTPKSPVLGKTGLGESGMAAEEAEAIRAYTGASYQGVNKSLNLGRELNEFQARIVPLIDKGLERLKGFQGKVYRKTSFPTKDATKAFADLHKEGEIVTYKSYISTSQSQQASSFNFSTSSSQTVRFSIDSKSGRYIKKYSDHKAEEEVLFGRDSKFLVKKVENLGSDGYIVHMEEILR